jgi:C4-dicarboxylate-specific signal transduction histidine kinase
LNKSALSSIGPDDILNQVIDIARSAALGEMASGIAHELNQPLGAIATFSQAGMRMLERPEPMVARALDVFKQINNEALSAGEGIRRIRRLFDQEDIVRTRCRMEELIIELRPALDLLSKRCNGRFEVTPAPTSPELSVDRAKIQHVLFSLVQNGFEAASGGSPPPLVLISVNSDRYGVETSIVDSGSGVPAESRQRLFRPFYTTKSRGTGLGLASSHSILEAHEGSIGFENLTGGGCRFWFRLPVAGK